MLVLAGTRILARQLSPWEWDDFVFAAALDTFAPHQQVPHPPFYPGFVGVGWWLVLLARRRRWALTGAAAAAAVSLRPQTAVVVALPWVHLVVP